MPFGILGSSLFLVLLRYRLANLSILYAIVGTDLISFHILRDSIIECIRAGESVFALSNF
jgi:hypothetical protein